MNVTKAVANDEGLLVSRMYLSHPEPLNDSGVAAQTATPRVYKRSDGIACCRIGPNGPEILLGCKRVSYAYILFMFGRYDSTNSERTVRLLSGTFVNEKHIILSLNFTHMWYHLWLCRGSTTHAFFAAKLKFESTFLADGGIKLRRLVSRAGHSRPVWEIPKGKKKPNETELSCAIREFQEETGISKKDYRFMTTNTRVYTYTDDHVTYINKYYIAFMEHRMTPRITLTTEQSREISDLRWVDLNQVRLLDSRLVGFVAEIFRFVKKTIKLAPDRGRAITDL
jgi:8-oxo-dGTP pyrophosphatase MutT (NUDIX family)